MARWTTSKLAALCAVLLLTACGKSKTESSRMHKDHPPSWQKMFDEQKAKARERTLRLIEAHKTYPRPVSDPHIVRRALDGRISLVDTETGDTLTANEADRETRLINFHVTTGSGDFVGIIKTQWGGGHFMPWETFPVRVYKITEAIDHTEETRRTHKRMTIARFAEFLSAFPRFANNPTQQFLVIDAPATPSEPV